MAILGIRCSNKDYSFVILAGDSNNPTIEEKGNVRFPKGFSRSLCLKWFLQELEGILKRHDVRIIAIKGTEGLAARGKSFVERVENEAMIYLSAANLGIKNVYRKVKSTIAKDFGLKGKAKYLSTKLDCSVFPTFDNEDNKTQEAILVAWSSMK